MTRIWNISIFTLILSWILIFFAAYLGYAAPFFSRSDMFADFVKIALQFPGGKIAHDPLGFDVLIERFQHDKGYFELGNGFLPPVTTLLCLLIRFSFTYSGPVLIASIVSAVCVSTLYTISKDHSREEGIAWFIILSYPTLFMLDRGNLFAGLTAVLGTTALLRRKADLIGAILLAIAINIRPNMLFCVLPFLSVRFLCLSSSLTVGIGVAAIAIVRSMLPTYTIGNFEHGQAVYLLHYVLEGWGVPFGSSLYGAFWLSGHTLPLSLFPALAALFAGTALKAFRTGRMSYGDLCFVVVACMFIGTPILNDYHLLLFSAPLILSRTTFIRIACMLLLLPKGYGEFHGATIQVILNPTIMISAIIWLLVRSIKAPPAADAVSEPLSPPQELLTNG